MDTLTGMPIRVDLSALTDSQVEVDSEVEEGVAEADEVEVVSGQILRMSTMVSPTNTLTPIPLR